MKVNLDKLEGLAHKLSFEIPAEKVRTVFEKAYKGIQKNVALKGFRKGKAPLNVIRSHYGDQVKDDVLRELIAEAYQNALEEHALDPVGHPSVHFDKFENNEDFLFSAEFEIRPEINLRKYEGLQIEKQKIEVTESQVQESLEKIQLSQAELVPIFEDRPAQMGDTAQLDFEGFVDGEPLEGAKAERYKLELGSGQFIEGFEEGLVGMRPGSTTELNLSFPSEYQNSQLAGKPVKFKVSLLGLEKKLLPAIDDELAKKEGAFENLQDLKEHIRKQLVEEENQNQMSEMRNKILKALVEENPVEVPRSLHQRQKELIVEDVRKRMSQQGLSELDFEEYKKKWSEDFDQSATFIVQSSFLVDALADKLSLRPTHDELHEKISEIARQTGLSESLLSDYYHKPENESRLSFQLMEEKVVACLVEKANIVEVQKPPELS